MESVKDSAHVVRIKGQTRVCSMSSTIRNRRFANTESRSARSAPHPAGSTVLSDLAWNEVARSLRLSPRELQILRGMFDNATESTIAAGLGLSPHTVHSHLNRLFRKLSVSTRSELVVRVWQEWKVLTTTPDGCSRSPLPTPSGWPLPAGALRAGQSSSPPPAAAVG